MNQGELTHAKIELDKNEAEIFDMGGVITKTARAHDAARKRPWRSKMP